MACRSARRLRLRMPEFARLTREAGHSWVEIELTDWFAQWMAAHEYHQAYFDNPNDMDLALKDFARYTITTLRARMTATDVDSDTVVAISGLASLFGLTSVSKIIDRVTPDIRGRLLAFFPGHKDGTVYYLLDACAGYNYVGIPILPTVVL